MSKITKTAQDTQDEIFRKMSADQKIEVASGLWRLAKELAADKINYGINRSAPSTHSNRRDS